MQQQILKTTIYNILYYPFLFFVFFVSTQQNILAQELSPQFLQVVPQAKEKLLSPDVRERISVLEFLIIPKRGISCIGGAEFRHGNLLASDYTIVVKSILDANLSSLDDRQASEMWWRIVYVAGHFNLKELAKPIASHLRKSPPLVHGSIIRLLRNLQAIEAIPEILSIWQWTAKYNRHEILETLIHFQAKEAVPIVLASLHSINHYERFSAIKRLVKLNAKESAPHIARLLKDENLDNRYWALDALVKFDFHKTYVPEIRQILSESKNLESKTYAIAALVDSNDRETIPLAIERLSFRRSSKFLKIKQF